MKSRFLIGLAVGLAFAGPGAAAANFEAVRTAEVRVVAGVPTLLINGQPHNPLIYFGGSHRITSARDGGGAQPMSAAEWHAKRPRVLHAVELAANHGVHLHSIDVWMPWTKPGAEGDFSDAEQAVAAVLARDPEGMLLLRFTMEPPEWWRNAHPDELMAWQGPNGTTQQLEERNYPQQKTVASVASEVWRREAGEQLAHFVRHMEARFGPHIFGYHFCGQNTHEWFYLGSRAEKLNCVEGVFTDSWQRWLRAKYGSDDALRAAWADPAASFATAAPPTYDQRLHASFEFFRDPAGETRTIDFHEYQNVAVVEALEHFAGVVKRESHKLAVCFYGYLFEHGTIQHGVQQSGHLALARLLRCPDIDAICSPISYNGGGRGYNSRMPGGIAAFMTAVDSVALHGKLWFNEDDTRTHLAKERGQPALASPAETRAVHQRNFAHLLVRGTSCWWMDLPGTGWLDDEGIWENLGALARLYDASMSYRTAYAPEIAVIVDERSCYALTQDRQPLARNLLYALRDPLYRLGAPCGFYLLEDLVAGRVPPKKLYVFANCFALTAADRSAIAHQCTGKTAVFLYANGLLDRTVDARNMEALLGVPLVLSRQRIGGECEPVSHPLTRGVSTFGVEEITPVISLARPGGLPAATELLATYKANGQPAAWKHMGDMTTIYIGALAVPAALLRNIAATAGVHLYAEAGDVVEANEHFVALHAARAGEKRFGLPRSAEVRDALTRRVIGDTIASWSVTMEKGETRLFSIAYRENAPRP